MSLGLSYLVVTSGQFCYVWQLVRKTENKREQSPDNTELLRMTQYQQMRAEDEQQHEDGLAIAAGTMCSFCLSVMHVATSYDTCPRIQQEEAEAAQAKQDADNEAYWLNVAPSSTGKPDFTCTNCSREFFTPHEGYFLDVHDEEVGRCIDCHIKNFKPCTDEKCCA